MPQDKSLFQEILEEIRQINSNLIDVETAINEASLVKSAENKVHEGTVRETKEKGYKFLKNIIFEARGEEPDSIEHVDLGYTELFDWFSAHQDELIKAVEEENNRRLK